MAFHVLFVCTGNTCRSPMAEGLCRSFLIHFRLQDEVDVASAGLYATPGGSASQEAVAAMAKKGIDLSGHRTVGLSTDIVQWAHLILTMEERQRQRLLEKFPEAAGKVFILKEYVTTLEAASGAPAIKKPGLYDILDPFGQPAPIYHQCAMELASAVTDLCIDIYRRLQRDSSPG